MKLNGTVNIERDDNAIYVLSYAPLGVDHFGRPRRRFKGWQPMVAFLQGPLHVGAQDVRAALNDSCATAPTVSTACGCPRRRCRSTAWAARSAWKLQVGSPTPTLAPNVPVLFLRGYWTLVQWRDGMASPTIANHRVSAATVEVVRVPR
jgi:hypothetical protein